jgi:hypothetical protein
LKVARSGKCAFSATPKRWMNTAAASLAAALPPGLCWRRQRSMASAGCARPSLAAPHRGAESSAAACVRTTRAGRVRLPQVRPRARHSSPRRRVHLVLRTLENHRQPRAQPPSAALLLETGAGLLHRLFPVPDLAANGGRELRR